MAKAIASPTSGSTASVSWRRHAGHTPALILVPAVLIAACMLVPLAYLVWRTLSAGGGVADLVFRARTLQLLIGTAGLALVVTAAATALSVPLAWLTVRTDLPYRRVWAVLTILPLVIPTYVGGFTLVAALGPRGMLQQLLAAPLGVERLPEIYGFTGAALALTLFAYPYTLLGLRASMRGLDPALEEAARGLGHGAWSTFRRATLPQLRPALASGALLVALYTLSDFGAVSLLQFDSFTRAIYMQYQGSFDRTMAAVFALILAALTLVVLIGEARTRGRARYHRSTVGTVRPLPIVRLGRWRWPALLFCALVIVCALLLPVSVLLYWLARGVTSGESFRLLFTAAANSVYASVPAAIVAIVAALPVAILSVRYPGRVSAVVERATYSGFALPGIVIALALVFFGANYITPLYQTLFLLVAAYVVRFLPQAVGATRSSLLQVSPSLEEAARGLGRGPLQVLAAVTIPLVRSGMLAGAALVFLTAMKELPATLLLSPIGFKTLATATWASAAQGFFAEAAAPALLMVVLSGVSMAFLHREEGKGRHE